MKSPSPSKKNGLILLGLLTILIRYPITPSATGTDNFYYISMVQAILSHGQIFWAENILSFYGLFPGTTPLGSSIFATTICSVTGLSIHQYQLIHSIILSLISTFGFFMLTGEFTENYRSRWFAALCFSFAPRFLTFSIWRFSLRFTFIALLPFFIWLLLRLSNSKYISFLDADDYWANNKLLEQISFMEKFNYGFTYTDYTPFIEKKK